MTTDLDATAAARRKEKYPYFTQLRLSPKYHAKLMALAAHHSLSRTEYIRRLIDEEYNQHELALDPALLDPAYTETT